LVATNPRLIYLDGTAEQTGDWLHLHGLADAVQHVPSRFVGDLLLSGDFPCGDAVFG
jgi:hypothetical protein